MNSFGLGLVLNFVDNASAGMNVATNNFLRMSATADSMTASVSASAVEMASIAFSLSAVGDTFVSIGESITGVFTGITQQVISTGNEILGYRMQLNALYGSAEAGEAKMEELKTYAMNSVFEIQSLIPAVTMMKAVGIEAMDEVTTSSGKATQKLLDYASDLAAMQPYMRNVYGTGVKAAMGAFKEYIAEGNAISLKRGAGLDITAILGEEKASTIEGRTQQIADLIEKLNILGYTANLAGTPMQRMSNMQDALFNTLTQIADSGVFEAYCILLEKLSDWVFSLVNNEETFNVITGVLADTITTLLSPLQSMLDWVIKNSDAIIEWVKEHPKLTKNILVTVFAIGAFLIAGGSLLKMLSSIAFAMSGFQMLKSLPSLLSIVGRSFTTLVTKALPFVALAGLAYFAWKNNLLGIRDTVKDLGTIFSLIGDAWADNTLSVENYNLADSLGILPLIESLLMLKYYWGFLVEGFKTGFKSFFESLAESLSFMEAFGIDVNGIASSLGELMRGLLDTGAEDKWERIGEIAGNIAASFIALAVIINVFKPIVSILSFIGKIGSFIGKVFKGVWSILKTVFSPLLNVFAVLKGGQGVGFFTKLLEVIKAVASGGIGLKDAMTIVFGSVGTAIMGVISLIVGIAGAVTGFVKQLTDGFSWFWEIVKWIGIALAVVGAILLGVSAWPAVIVGAIVGVLTLLIVLIKDNWNAICKFFSTIGSWIYDNVIKPVADFFVDLWNGIVTGVTTAFNAVKNFLSGVASWIYNTIIKPVVSFFTDIIFPIIAKIVEIVAKIVEIVIVLFVQLVKQIYIAVIKPIADFFVWLWGEIVSIVTSIVEGIKSIFFTVVDWINTTIIQPVAGFFSWMWEGIIAGVTTFIETVKSVFLTIVEWVKTNIVDPIAGFFSMLWEGIKTAFDAVVDTVSGVIKGAINTVLGFVCGIINGVIKAINFAIDIINAIPGVEITKITELKLPELATGGVVDKPTTAIIGEAGTEAVVPLENNLGWLDVIASKLASALFSGAVTPEPNNSVVATTVNTDTKTDNQYLTSNYNSVQEGNTDNSSNKEETHIDNSVTFEAGSIVIQLANTTDAELEKVAEKLMKIIARKQQLRAMAVRA